MYLNDRQKLALEKFEDGESFFITGPAGEVRVHSYVVSAFHVLRFDPGYFSAYWFY